jgi:hypothetical protein
MTRPKDGIMNTRNPALLMAGCIDGYFREEKTGGAYLINIDGVLCD